MSNFSMFFNIIPHVPIRQSIYDNISIEPTSGCSSHHFIAKKQAIPVINQYSLLSINSIDFQLLLLLHCNGFLCLCCDVLGGQAVQFKQRVGLSGSAEGVVDADDTHRHGAVL